MKIGIDARFLTHPQKGGFKTYTENLIQAILEIDKANEYFIYLDRHPSQATSLPDRANLTIRVITEHNQIYGMAWREQYALPRQVRKDKLDLFHSPCLTAPLLLDLPLIVTIHDMIWFYPNRYSNQKIDLGKRQFMRWYYRIVPQIVTRKAQAVVTVSHASKQSIIKYMQVDASQIFVTHESASRIYGPIEDSSSSDIILQKYRLCSNFILGLGSADPRKNIKTLLKSYASLPESLKDGHQLVIVCNHKSLATKAALEAQQLGISKHLHCLENVSDQDLVYLYNLAALFVFPSLEEGFGLPLLEAMACGTPVLAANNSSIPEIVGDAALQFSAEDTGKLTELILNVLTNPWLQQEMKKRGIDRAAIFSWKKCAEETLNVYKKVLG